MGLIVGLVLVIALLWLAAMVVGSLISVLGYLLLGLVVGALARLIVPGEQNMGWLSTILFGIAGALIGGLLASRVFDLGNIMQFVLAVVVAALLVAAFAGTTAGTRDRRRGV